MQLENEIAPSEAEGGTPCAHTTTEQPAEAEGMTAIEVDGTAQPQQSKVAESTDDLDREPLILWQTRLWGGLKKFPTVYDYFQDLQQADPCPSNSSNTKVEVLQKNTGNVVFFEWFFKTPHIPAVRSVFLENAFLTDPTKMH